MARRLVYSQGGFDRALMMVRAGIVGIVEGRDDIRFYELLLEHYLSERGGSTGLQIRTPREVAAEADGKKALVSIFTRLRRGRHLRIRGGGGKAIVFFLDKDYDDYARRTLRNPHVIYTPGVTMENSAYEAGRLHQSLEAILGRGISAGALPSSNNFGAWKVNCAQAWRDWLVYCFVCDISGVAPRKNRSGPSSIHCGDPPSVRTEARDALFEEVVARLGDRVAAQNYYRRAQRAVDAAIRSGQVDKVFCGKWFPYFLKADVQRLGAPYASAAGNVVRGGALLSHLFREMVFHGAVRSHYFSKLDAVLQ